MNLYVKQVVASLRAAQADETHAHCRIPTCTCGEEYISLIEKSMNFQNGDTCVVKVNDALITNLVYIKHSVHMQNCRRFYLCIGCNHYGVNKKKVIESCTCKSKQTTTLSVAAEDDNQMTEHADLGTTFDIQSDIDNHDDEGLAPTANGSLSNMEDEIESNFNCDDSDEGLAPTANGSLSMEDEIESNFNDTNAFNNKTSNYFKNAHKHGNGKKFLVAKALDLNSENISTDEVNAALLRSRIHFKVTKNASHDVIQLSNHDISGVVKENEQTKNLIYECMKESITELMPEAIKGLVDESKLSEIMKSLELSNMSEKIAYSTKEKVANSEMQMRHTIDHPDMKQIRNQYTEGKNSILQNIPIPDVEMAYDFAWVPLEQTINLFLALGLPLLYYQNDADWKDDKGEYEGEFFESLHKKIQSDPLFVEGTRSYFCRGWSDGFELHKIVVDKDHNNLQLFTISFLGENGQHQSWPYAIGYKADDHSNILNKFLKEAKELEKPTKRYVGGAEKKVVPVSIHLQAMMNDYIERVANTFTSQNGKFTHRWGYSSIFCRKTTPSCGVCRAERIQRILSYTSGAATATTTVPPSCPDDCCHDWWRTIEKNGLDKYPIRVTEVDEIIKWEKSGELKMFPAVRLNFNILKSAVKEVQQYYNDCIAIAKRKGRRGKPKIKGKCEKYLQVCGIQQKLVTLMLDKLFAGENIVDMIPEVWDDIMESGLDLFVLVPMHLCTLGIENTLITNTSVFLKKEVLLESGERKSYKEFVSEVQRVHRRISPSSIGWLKTQPFTSKDDLGISNWLSQSYLSFTRASLVLYGVLDEKGEVDANQKAFQEVRVLWFCLMAHMFADESVSTHILDDYARLFLDACVKIHNCTDRKNSFYEGCTNFFSILNIKRTCDINGSVRNLWEGGEGGERDIQKYKGENVSGFMRHNPEFMMTFTEKVMKSYMLDRFNKDNPLCKRAVYAKTINFTIYKSHTTPEALLDEDIVSSGVILDDRLYICFASSGPEVVLKRLNFNDNAGKWHYNLYYAPASIVLSNTEDVILSSREEVIEKSSDVFALFGRVLSNEDLCFTMICRSWRVRDDHGELRLPTPREDVFYQPKWEEEPMDEDDLQSTSGVQSCSSTETEEERLQINRKRSRKQ